MFSPAHRVTRAVDMWSSCLCDEPEPRRLSLPQTQGGQWELGPGTLAGKRGIHAAHRGTLALAAVNCNLALRASLSCHKAA